MIITWVAFMACFCSFAVGIRYGFARASGEKLDLRARLILIISTAFAVVHLVALVRPRSGPKVAIICVAIYTLSLLLFWKCLSTTRRQQLPVAFSAHRPQRIVREGPYRHVRHPIYVSYMLAWSACPVATGQPWPAVCAATMAVIYYHAARSEEQALLSGPLGPDYLLYRRTTGMVLPRSVHGHDDHCEVARHRAG